ncbi:MAG: polysaccharide pyruvyl transferase family protein [Thermoleophilia bacterium]|nr:polysaccharide pyruvyl transferase family protein [Thermoleophilia bacterium]
MTVRTGVERVLLVGAFERDNFGDLLFHLLTRQYLVAAGFDVDAASVLSAHVAATPDLPIMSMHEALSTRAYRAVWVVGGEVGGVRVVDAFGMSLPELERRVFSSAQVGAQEIFARFASGLPLHAPAYLPALDRYPLNRSAALIVNSVGVSHLSRGLAPDAMAESMRILATASHLTVRDEESQSFLDTHSIPSVLSPDVIHSISSAEGWSREEIVEPEGAPYLLLQVNVEQLTISGLTRVADLIAELWEATGVPVRLFAAGITHGHDSVSAYDALIALLRKRYQHVECDRIRDRAPSRLVAEIAGAALWIGTSLHGRIVAESYGVPRISLTNDKVARYARRWDNLFPSDLTLGAAVLHAPGLVNGSAHLASATPLARAAESRLQEIISTMKGRPV